jgi:hypothetical protein
MPVMSSIYATTTTVPLPSDLVEAAREAVARGHAADVPAYVAAALQDKLEIDQLGDLIDALLTFAAGNDPQPSVSGLADARTSGEGER